MGLPDCEKTHCSATLSVHVLVHFTQYVLWERKNFNIEVVCSQRRVTDIFMMLLFSNTSSQEVFYSFHTRAVRWNDICFVLKCEVWSTWPPDGPSRTLAHTSSAFSIRSDLLLLTSSCCGWAAGLGRCTHTGFPCWASPPVDIWWRLLRLVRHPQPTWRPNL